MNIREAIKKYQIMLVPNVETGLIEVSNVSELKADEMVEFIKEHKQEIVHELKALKGEYIPGLKEIQEAEAIRDTWKETLEDSFESEDVSPLPNYDPNILLELRREYPQATAFLAMKALANSGDYELASIGKASLEMVVDGDWKGAIQYAGEKEREFASKHLWD